MATSHVDVGHVPFEDEKEHGHKRIHGVESRDSVIKRASSLGQGELIDLCDTDEISTQNTIPPIQKKRKLFHSGNDPIHVSTTHVLPTPPDSVSHSFSQSPLDCDVALVPTLETQSVPSEFATNTAHGHALEVTRLWSRSPVQQLFTAVTPDRDLMDNSDNTMFFPDKTENVQSSCRRDRGTQNPVENVGKIYSDLSFQGGVLCSEVHTFGKREQPPDLGRAASCRATTTQGDRSVTSRLKTAADVRTRFSMPSERDPLASRELTERQDQREVLPRSSLNANAQASQQFLSATNGLESDPPGFASSVQADSSARAPSGNRLSLLERLGQTLTASLHVLPANENQKTNSVDFPEQGVLSELKLPKAFETFDIDMRNVVVRRETLRERERDLQALVEVYTAAARFLSLEPTGRVYQQAQKELRELTHFADAVLDHELSGKRVRARVHDIRDNLNRRTDKLGRAIDDTRVDEIIGKLLPSHRLEELEHGVHVVKTHLLELRTQTLEARKPRKRGKGDTNGRVPTSRSSRPKHPTKQIPHLTTKEKRQAQYEAYADRQLDTAQAVLARLSGHDSEEQGSNNDGMSGDGLGGLAIFSDYDAVSEVSEDETGAELVPRTLTESVLEVASSRKPAAVSTGSKLSVAASQSVDEQMGNTDPRQRDLRAQRPHQDLLQQQCAAMRTAQVYTKNSSLVLDKADEVLGTETLSVGSEEDDEIVEVYRYTVKGVFQGCAGRMDGEEYRFGQYWDRRTATKQYELVVEEIESQLPRHEDFEYASRTSQGLPESQYKAGGDDGCLCRIWIDSSLVEPDVKAYEDAKLIEKLQDTFVYLVEWEHTTVRHDGIEEEVDQQAATVNGLAGSASRGGAPTSAPAVVSDNGELAQTAEATRHAEESRESTDGQGQQSPGTATVISTELEKAVSNPLPEQAGTNNTVVNDDEQAKNKSTVCQAAKVDEAGGTTTIVQNHDDLFEGTPPPGALDQVTPAADSGAEESTTVVSTPSEVILTRNTSDSRSADLFASMAYANRAAKLRFMEWYITHVADLRTVQIMDDDLEDELRRCGDRYCWTQEQDFSIDTEDKKEGGHVVDRMRVWIGKRQIRGPIP